MDIWHTALAEEVGTEGWLGRAIRDMDPNGENVLTGVNFGRGLPRALGCPGVPVASVGDLETYGLFPDMQDQALREYALETFGKMYGGAEGKDAVMGFLGQTGLDALRGADILRTAPGMYESTVEYAANPMAQGLKSAAQVMFADLGTRVYFTQHGSFDTHSGELFKHEMLWNEVAPAVGDFYDDLVARAPANRLQEQRCRGARTPRRPRRRPFRPAARLRRAENAASGGPRGRRRQGRSYKTLPSRSAAWRTVPTTCPRRSTSSGVATTMSLLIGRSPSDLRMSTAVRRLSGTSGNPTSRSTSLHGCAVPRAWEPNSRTLDGWKRSTIRSTIVDIVVSDAVTLRSPRRSAVAAHARAGVGSRFPVSGPLVHSL